LILLPHPPKSWDYRHTPLYPTTEKILKRDKLQIRFKRQTGNFSIEKKKEKKRKPKTTIESHLQHVTQQ
jgi:hypothetical protein